MRTPSLICIIYAADKQQEDGHSCLDAALGMCGWVLSSGGSCVVLDGKAYSEAASKNYHKMPVDQRVVLFRFFLFLFPPAPTDPPASPTEQAWLSMCVPRQRAPSISSAAS